MSTPVPADDEDIVTTSKAEWNGGALTITSTTMKLVSTKR